MLIVFVKRLDVQKNKNVDLRNTFCEEWKNKLIIIWWVAWNSLIESCKCILSFFDHFLSFKMSIFTFQIWMQIHWKSWKCILFKLQKIITLNLIYLPWKKVSIVRRQKKLMDNMHHSKYVNLIRQKSWFFSRIDTPKLKKGNYIWYMNYSKIRLNQTWFSLFMKKKSITL